MRVDGGLGEKVTDMRGRGGAIWLRDSAQGVTDV